jgi:hypothetical protein
MSKLSQMFSRLVTGTEPVKRAAKPMAPKSFAKLTERDLIRLESKLGSQLFGAVPKGHRREFFCLDEHTWIWYEEWTDSKGKRQSITTRYEVHPNNILKVQDNQPYQVVEGAELHNLAMATRLYREQVIRGIYHRDHITGQPLQPVHG